MGSARFLVRVALFGAVLGGTVGCPALAQTAAPPTANAPRAAGVADVVTHARKLVAGGDLAHAIAELAAYVAANPRDLEPARYLGDLYYRAADVAAAERTYLDILRVAPGDRETHNRLGGIYASRDRVTEAIAQFALSLPEVSAYGHLVELHRRAGDLDAFESGVRRAAESAPNDASAVYALGTVYRAERRPELAARTLERALDLAPRSCATLAELGSAYLDLERTNDAVTVLRRCLDREPGNYAALVNLGDALIDQGRFDDARRSFDRALAAWPDGAEAMVDIGYLEDVAGHWDAAIASYLRAIGSDPLVRDAYVDLGYDYQQRRLYALAEAAYLKGLSVAPADGRLHYLLGATYLAQGKRELARAEYRRATASDEPDVASAANRSLVSLQ